MLKKVWKMWKAFGLLLGNLVSRVILTVFYWTVFVPFAVGARIFSDHLGLKSLPRQYWQARPELADTLETAKNQA